MRGKLGAKELGDPLTRDIPAYAGKTLGESSPSTDTPEHPRVCGENIPVIGEIAQFLGTSPRMRGKREGVQAVLGRDRNIPAYAGKTYRSASTGSKP